MTIRAGGMTLVAPELNNLGYVDLVEASVGTTDGTTWLHFLEEDIGAC